MSDQQPFKGAESGGSLLASAPAPAPAPTPKSKKDYKGFISGIFSGIAKLSGKSATSIAIISPGMALDHG